MATKRDNFKLGLTILIMFLLFVASLLFIGGSDILVPATRSLVVRFLPGITMPEISAGSVVVYFGQNVGEVSYSILVEGQHPKDPEIKDLQFLEVHARVRTGLDLRQDCRILATGPPLGGKGYLEILSRGTSSEALQERDYLIGSVAGFQAIIDNLSRELDQDNPQGLLASIKLQLDSSAEASLVAKIHLIMENVREATASLSRELDEQRQEVVITKVHLALDKINNGLAEAVALLKDNRPKIDEAVTSVQGATKKLDEEVMAVVARELQLDGGTEPGTLITKIHDSLDCVKGSLYDINVLTTAGKNTVVLNKDRISELVQNTTDASALLKSSIKDLGLNPWKILFQPSTAEKRELHIYNVAREFAQAAAHLDDASSRLKSLVDSKLGYIRADDPDLVEIRSDLEATLQRFSAAEQALMRELKVE